MNVIHTKLNIGATKPFKIVHVSDTHFTYADDRDDERKIAMAGRRRKVFPDSEKVLAEAVRVSKELSCPIIHTGDLSDFVSVANLEAVRKFLAENDCFFVAGNHEFARYIAEADENAEYRNLSLATVQAAFTNDIRMASRVINGVNFVALDDGYYLIEPEQMEFLKNEVEKGLPIVLMMHVPLFEQNFFDDIMPNRSSAHMLAVPKELMANYDRGTYYDQLADDLTYEAWEYITSQPNIKAILTGHLHFNYECMIKDRLPQILTGMRDVRVVEIE
ncbi:MAG: metallophosphoesterase [Clostridia bacterium]|nr:metallophosphoesterase [Clostridia bacterium]